MSVNYDVIFKASEVKPPKTDNTYLYFNNKSICDLVKVIGIPIQNNVSFYNESLGFYIPESIKT